MIGLKALAQALSCSALLTVTGLLATAGPARADSCASVYPGASTAGYQGPYGGYDYDGNCHVRDISESRCRAIPGFIRWNKDSGAGFTHCVFRPPSSSTPSSPAPQAEFGTEPSNTQAMEKQAATTKLGRDRLVLIFRNAYGQKIDLKFFSQDREWFWPGKGEVFILYDPDWAMAVLGCKQGEKICYGAAVRIEGKGYGGYWGVGIKGDKSCSKCCWRCGEQSSIDWRTLRD